MLKKILIIILINIIYAIPLFIYTEPEPAIKDLIFQYADKYGIDRYAAYDLAMAESSLNPKAIGSCGERGLYQIRQKTWEWMTKISFDKAYEIEPNIETAMRYLAWIKRNLGERYTHALLFCAYNMGLQALKNRNYKVPKTHKNRIYRRYYETR